jgi:hypothetical protein
VENSSRISFTPSNIFTQLKKLVIFAVRVDTIVSSPLDLPELEFLQVHHCILEDISSLRQLKTLKSSLSIIQLGKEILFQLKSLNCDRGLNLEENYLLANPSLQSLTLNNYFFNEFESFLSFQQQLLEHKHLKEVHIHLLESSHHFKEFRLNGSSSSSSPMKSLSITNNSIKVLRFVHPHKSHYESISVEGCPPHHFQFVKSLEKLSLSYVNLKDLFHLRSIPYLHLSHCYIEDYSALENGSKQRYLNLSHNDSLKNEDLVFMSAARYLAISSCHHLYDLSSLSENLYLIANDCSDLEECHLTGKNYIYVDLRGSMKGLQFSCANGVIAILDLPTVRIYNYGQLEGMTVMERG